MTTVNSFTPKQLSAAQYVLALHQPEDRVAVLVRNRARAQTIQRILLAEDMRVPTFRIGSRNKTIWGPTSSWE